MSYTTKAEMLSETRKAAKELGMTFKVDDSRYLNGQTAYMLTNRKTGEVLSRNYTVSNGYESAMSGCFAKISSEAGLA